MHALKRHAYRAVLSVAKGRFFSSRLVDRLTWDTAPKGSLLLSRGRESFVVAASDQVIAREVFLKRKPFDFDKLERVMGLLGCSPATLIDVGANIGTVCIPAVKRRLFERAVAVEPEPLNFSLLTANIAINDVSAKVQAHNVALSDTTGQTLAFDLSDDNFGDHRPRYGPVNASRRTIEVETRTLDELASGSVLIWMDVQGFEGHVLGGGRKTLQDRPPMVLEFWPEGLKESGGFEPLKAALQRAGYAAMRDLRDDRVLPLTAIDELAAAMGAEQTDLLFV